jgi:hypothetical protein
MPEIHRHGDSRACGATTVVSGQSNVYAGGQLVSVNGDNNTDGAGGLVAACAEVFVNSKKVVINGNGSAADSLCVPLAGAHCSPSANSGLSTVVVGS